MITVALPHIGTAAAWRRNARALLIDGVEPADVGWHREGESGGLFDTRAFQAPDTVPARASVRVSRRFVELADVVCWHSDPDRFAKLYACLWRLHQGDACIDDQADPDLAALNRMQKAVRRAQHKMKAFVRFREVPSAGYAHGNQRRFAAWFEPPHPVTELTAPFFARRFADMDWRIVTPEKTAIFENGELHFEPGGHRPDLPDDASEELWLTYFRNIFNPARLKVSAMTAEMPKQYWGNLPEARAIASMIEEAPARVREMAERAPGKPARHAVKAAEMQRRFRSAWSE